MGRRARALYVAILAVASGLLSKIAGHSFRASPSGNVGKVSASARRSEQVYVRRRFDTVAIERPFIGYNRVTRARSASLIGRR